MISIDIKRAVGLYRRDGAERVGPCTRECRRTGASSSYASAYERDQRAREKKLKKGLFFHGAILPGSDGPSSVERSTSYKE